VTGWTLSGGPGPGMHTRLDDLLEYDDEPEPRGGGNRFGVWLAKASGWSALFSLLLWAAFRASGLAVPFLLLFTGSLALFGLARIARQVAPPQLDEDRVRSAAQEEAAGAGHWPVVDGLWAAVSRWDNRLGWTYRDPARFDSQVRPLLGELVDERLRQRYGFTRASDPQRARAVLGEPLWTFLATPVTRSPTPRDLAEVARQMEAL